MKNDIKRFASIFMVVTMFVAMASCGVVKSGTTEYNELVALVQGGVAKRVCKIGI